MPTHPPFRPYTSTLPDESALLSPAYRNPFFYGTAQPYYDVFAGGQGLAGDIYQRGQTPTVISSYQPTTTTAPTDTSNEDYARSSIADIIANTQGTVSTPGVLSHTTLLVSV